jgi:hypothetical protein
VREEKEERSTRSGQEWQSGRVGYAETAINALMPQPVRPRSRLWGWASLSLIAVIDAGGKAAHSLEAKTQVAGR